MIVSEFLQFPNKFVQIEANLFSDNESTNMIHSYRSMSDQNLSRTDKISMIKEILNICGNSVGKERKKIICLLTFSILQTPFGRSLIQENERFRKVVFDRYDLFISEDDQDFVEAMRERRI